VLFVLVPPARVAASVSIRCACDLTHERNQKSGKKVEERREMALSRLFALSLHLSGPPSPESFELGEGSTALTRFINSTLEDNIYQSVCLPITNARWAERWKRMCLDSSNVPEEGENDSTSVMDSEVDATVRLDDNAVTERNKGTESHRVAEGWRAGISGRFQRDEVNLTKIGADLFFVVRNCMSILILVDEQRKRNVRSEWRQTGSS
jgi:hypothetical protein